MLTGNHWRGWRGDARERVMWALADVLRHIGWACDDLGATRLEALVWQAYLWTISGERRS